MRGWPLIGDVGEHRRERIVVVPQVVVHFLEVPLVGAGLHVEREDRRREEVVAAALRSVLIGRGIADRDVDHAELRIDRRMRPERSAAVRPRIAFPRVVPEFAGAGNRVEPPQLLAGLRVEGGELAAHAAFAARQPGEDAAVGVDRRAGRAAAIDRDLDVPDRLAGLLIERDQPAARLAR